MAKINDRIATLNNAGINTGKYFSINLPKGLKPGSVVTVTINENGDAEVVDAIAKAIDDGDYINSGRLFRRWVMAQTFHMLNWESWDKTKRGYDSNLTARKFSYQFKMMLDEVHRLAKMERYGGVDFDIQKTFFTKDVIVRTCEDYLSELKKYVNGCRVKHCRHLPYKKVCGKNIFVHNLDEVYADIEASINGIKNVENYASIERQLKRFVNGMFKLPDETRKSDTWKSAFKGVGGYYTLQNLIRCHGVRIHENGKVLSRAESEAYLERKRVEYTGEGYRLIGLLKEVVRYNNFDFNKRMAELKG